MYYTIRGRTDSIEETPYERTINKGKADERKEMVQRFQLTLTIPGQQEAVKVDLSPEKIADLPKFQTMEQWETDETWVIVTADVLRTAKGETDGRAWAMFTFSAVKVEEMSATEKKSLTDARKQVKQIRKQKAAEARKAKAEAKKAASAQPAA